MHRARAVLRGADDALLDTYQSERLPVAEAVVSVTDKLFTVAAGQTGWEAKFRDMLAPVLINPGSHLDLVQTKAFRTVSEIDIAYPPSYASPAAEGTHTIAPGPVHRALDAPINRSTRLFDLICGYRFTVLALSRKPPDEAAAEQLGAMLTRLSQGKDIASNLVARLSVGRRPGVLPVEIVKVFDRYGLIGETAQALL